MKIYEVLANNEIGMKVGVATHADVGMRIFIRIEQQGDRQNDDALVHKLFYAKYSADHWLIVATREIQNIMFGGTSWKITD